MSDDRNPFPLDLMGEVTKQVANAGSRGLAVTEFDNALYKLIAGYLVAKGVLRISGGGGAEPYRMRVVKKEE